MTLLNLVFKKITTNGTAIALWAIVLLFCFSSCSRDKKQFTGAVTSRDSTSVLTTRGITSVVSENGIIKYRIKSDEWMVFDRMDPPYHSFEKGVQLEVFDSLMQVGSLIKADTAYFFTETELWKLIGNVHAENVDGEIFDTQLLFWDQKKRNVYSDSTIRIQQDNQIIIGRGFESNQDFTKYTIRKTEGVIPVKE
jgi:LPS export ABC transporter protein LptC